MAFSHAQENRLLRRIRLHSYRFIVGKSNRNGLTCVEIFHSSIAIIASANPNIGSQSKAALPLIHSGLNLMVVNCSPYFRWPVTIKLMRILQKQDLINGKIVTALRESPDGKRIFTRCFTSRENRHSLFSA